MYLCFNVIHRSIYLLNFLKYCEKYLNTEKLLCHSLDPIMDVLV